MNLDSHEEASVTRFRNFIWGLLHNSPWLGETLMELKDHLIHKVLNVASLWPPDKHQPVMGEPLLSPFLSDVGSMAKLQFYLDTLGVKADIKEVIIIIIIIIIIMKTYKAHKSTKVLMALVQTLTYMCVQ